MANTFNAHIKILTRIEDTGELVELLDKAEIDNLQEVIEVRSFDSDGEDYCDDETPAYIHTGYIELRWAVDVKEWQEVCKGLNISVMIQGEDEAMGFYQLVIINNKGEVVQDDSIEYTSLYLK